MIQIVVPSCEALSENVFLSLSAMENTKLVLMCTQEDYKELEKKGSFFNHIKNADKMICLKGEPAGPLCSCLMAIDEINNADCVLVMDHVVDEKFNLSHIVEQFEDADCGVVTVASECTSLPHVLLDQDSKEIIEASQDRVLSDRASAGIYYFKHGTDLVESAKNAIRKGCSVDNRYYITAAINEMILKNSKVKEVAFM